MGRDVHRRLLRHVPDDDVASRASAAGAFDAPGTYVQHHFFSQLPSSRLDGARETSSFHDNPRAPSSSATATSSARSATGAASSASLFIFILLPVVFLLHCCCCTRGETFDPGVAIDGHRGRRGRRGGARERRGRLEDGSRRRWTTSRDDADDGGFDPESDAASRPALSRHDALTSDDTPGPASDATIASLPRCVAGDDDWVSLVGDGGETAVCCPVCCETIERGRDARVTACAHVFHAGCIRAWLKVSGSCPTCRHVVTVLDAEEREKFWRTRRRAMAAAAAAAPPPPPRESRGTTTTETANGDLQETQRSGDDRRQT